MKSATHALDTREKINWDWRLAQIETAAAAGNMKKVSTEARAKPPLAQLGRRLALVPRDSTASFA